MTALAIPVPDVLAPGGGTAVSLERALRPAPLGLLVAGMATDVVVKIASEFVEWEEAFRLVAATYRSRGYEKPDARGLRFTPYHALPDTVTLVAKEDARVLATLSMVCDNTFLGLPSDQIYGGELDELRRQGRRLVEISSLADVGLRQRDFVATFVALVRLLAHIYLSQEADAMVITCTPRHGNFYRRVMGFVPLGPCRPYPWVQNTVAQAYLLDVDLLATNAPRMFQDIFGEPVPAAALDVPEMPTHLVRYFGTHSSQTDGRTIQDILEHVRRHGSPRRW